MVIYITDNKCIIVILGTAQDAGLPQLGCICRNCERALSNPRFKRTVSSIGIINQTTGRSYIIDCTPDFREQYFILDKLRNKYLKREVIKEPSPNMKNNYGIDGIFLTHGHMGHYLGLVQLGKEAGSASGVKIYGTKKMVKYLNANNPYKTLIKKNHISPVIVEHGKQKSIDENLAIYPFLVNHRQDFTDTLGYFITGPSKKLLYVPDMDTITQPVLENLPRADIALIDGTFYQDNELHPRRDFRLTPHLPILDSMKILKPYYKKTRIFYTHFNHTNPVVDIDSTEAKYVKDQGFGLAPEGWTFGI
jgi:pyrroloquinoline quinone biosynthesis protein B